MKAFTQPLHDLSEYDQIVSNLAGQRTPIHIDGCIDSQKCHLISSIGEPYPFKLIVTYNEIKAKEIYEDYKTKYGVKPTKPASAGSVKTTHSEAQTNYNEMSNEDFEKELQKVLGGI